MDNNNEYDVIILGTGIGGTMLGAILARHKLRVLMLDSETHPRFAIGEATTPDTNFRLKLLGLKYELPEISFLSAFQPLRDYISPACGVKRAFSFLYQREGKDQIATETHQYPTLAPPMGPDCHFFRQDTDAYMMAVAVNYGAKVRQKTRVADIDIQEDHVALTSEKGETFRGKYLVDGTGMKSVLSHKFQLRDDPDKFRTNTRVPFNNHQDSTNPLCSVGLVLNRRIHPETGMDAEEEFWSYVKKFPDMVRQFEGAQAIRGWVSTGRLQYGAKSITGHRYSLLSHAGFFIDPLYSTGLALTTAWVDLLGGQLLKAFASGDFSVESFEHLNVFFSNNIGYADEVVSSSFVAFRDFDLWDAWYRVWVVALLIGTALNASLYLKYRQTKDRRVSEAAQKIRSLFKGIKYVPAYWRWHEASVRTTPSFTIWGMTRMYIWFLLFAPAELRRPLFGWNPLTAYKYVFGSILENNGASRRRKRSYIRDVFKAWNRDWLPERLASSRSRL